MGSLDRKLIRDLWRMRAQVLAIALVVASGVAVLVMSLSTIEALDETARAYYERNRFADVFAVLNRAPGRLARRIAAIPGVQSAETRIVKSAILDVAGFDDPVIGQLVSVPESGPGLLNRLALRAGRRVAPGRPDEVVISEPFADAHGLKPGDSLGAVINGHRRALRIVGIALSPEYVYAIGPGALMPDDHRYGILWLGRQALEAAFDMDGAFNEVSLSLLRGARPQDVIDRLDRLLDRYGGLGAFARADQISNWFLMNEIEQLRSMSAILPTVFLAVAAFLTNMVLARLIATERSEIGLMKAFGYDGLEIGWHYAKMVIAITAVGILLGWLAGAWLGRFNTQVYAEFYRFPFLLFRPGPAAFAISALVSLAAALLGTLGSVRGAARLPPAEAMRPPAPPMYRRSALAGAWSGRLLDQPTRIILRQIMRWPVRAFLTTTGVAMAVAVLIISMQWLDSIEHIVEVYFFQGQRQDATVGLVERRPSGAERELRHLPGVLATEPGLAVSAIFRAGRRWHRGSIQGLPADARLSPVFDATGGEIPVPSRGLALSTVLAAKLGLEAGDEVTVEVREGRRPVLRLPVVRLFETYIGAPAYMELDAVNRLLGEGPGIQYVHMRIDDKHRVALFSELERLPQVSTVTLRQSAVDTFYGTMAETLLIFVSLFIVFACSLAVGVVYNSIRIALSERGRELATLRVLGFSLAEISYLLLGEAALLVLAALPLGCVIGYGLAWSITSAFETELYRIPMVINVSTYGIAASITLAATGACAALVRRRVDRLDMIAVLKTRE